MKYLDTSIENVDRLKKARSNINRGMTLTLILTFIILALGIFFMFNKIYSIGISLLVLAVFYFIMVTGLILKREIYSMMIFFKTKPEEE